MDGSDGAVGDAFEVEREAKVKLHDRPKDTPFLQTVYYWKSYIE